VIFLDFVVRAFSYSGWLIGGKDQYLSFHIAPNILSYFDEDDGQAALWTSLMM
jgi:hypothetical protein